MAVRLKLHVYRRVKGNYEPIFKDPKTDRKKKSAKGLLCVTGTNNNYVLESDVTPEREASEDNCLKTVFKDGVLTSQTSLAEIRERINSNF